MKFCLTLALAAVTLTVSARAEEATWTDPAKAKAEDPDFSIQGEYGSGKTGADWGLQVVALGDGAFDGYLLEDGLPGLGWERGKRRLKVSGKREGDTTTLKGEGIEIGIKDEVASVSVEEKAHTLPRIQRQSPTLGAKPPEGAVVLFDGSSADAWNNGQMDGDLLVNSGPISKEKFRDFTMHLEFRTPYKPKARGQRRGNSGVYYQGAYETQILDSFGLEGRSNEAGGIYSIAEPKLNMCLPPLSWQTYDVDFTAAQWRDGKKLENARITVHLNGVLIHENQELPKSTAAAKFGESAEPGPIYLQHHGNPIRFQNIWVMPKEAGD